MKYFLLVTILIVLFLAAKVSMAEVVMIYDDYGNATPYTAIQAGNIMNYTDINGNHTFSIGEEKQ